MKRCGDCGKNFSIGQHVEGGYYRCTRCDNREFDKRMKKIETDKKRKEDLEFIKEKNNLLKEQNDLIREQNKILTK